MAGFPVGSNGRRSDSTDKKRFSGYPAYGFIPQPAIYPAVLFIWFNRHLPFSWVIALGCFLNALVILLNKGSMPLAEIGPYVGKSEFANEYLLSGKLPVYHIINENTLLWFLGDVIWVPFFRIFISIGDIILYGGTFLLVQHLIADKKYSKKQPE